MKIEEDRGDLNTAASQDHRGTPNLEGKRVLLGNSDVGQSKGRRITWGHRLILFNGALHPAATWYRLGYCGLAASESPVAICMVCAVAETHDIYQVRSTRDVKISKREVIPDLKSSLCFNQERIADGGVRNF